jgi:hypothetical protein
MNPAVYFVYNDRMSDRPPDCDLHPYFRDPDRARAILDACIAESKRTGRSPVRVVHGKGKGDFKKLIYSHLEKHPDVDGFIECDPLHGGSGATWVHIAGIGDGETPAELEQEVKEKQLVEWWWRYLLYAIFVAASYKIFGSWTVTIVLGVALVLIEFRFVKTSD